jgi:hypothetical protein
MAARPPNIAAPTTNDAAQPQRQDRVAAEPAFDRQQQPERHQAGGDEAERLR